MDLPSPDQIPATLDDVKAGDYVVLCRGGYGNTIRALVPVLRTTKTRIYLRDERGYKRSSGGCLSHERYLTEEIRTTTREGAELLLAEEKARKHALRLHDAWQKCAVKPDYLVRYEAKQVDCLNAEVQEMQQAFDEFRAAMVSVLQLRRTNTDSSHDAAT